MLQVQIEEITNLKLENLQLQNDFKQMHKYKDLVKYAKFYKQLQQKKYRNQSTQVIIEPSMESSFDLGSVLEDDAQTVETGMSYHRRGQSTPVVDYLEDTVLKATNNFQCGSSSHNF